MRWTNELRLKNIELLDRTHIVSGTNNKCPPQLSFL
jgi:hypothetical protein